MSTHARSFALRLSTLGTLALLAWSVPSGALAGPGDLATKWPINDDDPMAFIPSIEDRNRDPLEFAYYLQDLVHRAEGAYDRQDWAGAVKYYAVLAAAVPDKVTSYSRMCDANARLGKIEQALEACRTALRMQGAKAIDHLHYLDLMLRKPSFSDLDAADVEASLAHLREHARLNPQALPGEQPATTEPVVTTTTADETAAAVDPKARVKEKVRELLEEQKGEPKPEIGAGALHLPTQIELASCRLAVRTGDTARLGECMARLRSYKVPEKLLLPFAWAEAIGQKDEARAAALLREAQERHGVAAEVLASMQAEQARAFAPAESPTSDRRPILAAAAVGLIAMLLVGLRRAKAQSPASTPRGSES